MKTPFFTVFTPVYNREKEIHRVWESLKKQTFRNFEWIVVDDGSTDQVWPLLEEYKEKADFPVTLLQQENKGNHFAWNRAVQIANGELFLRADSDDRFHAHTLQFFYDKWHEIPVSERDEISGISVLCSDSQTGKVVGNKFPQDGMVTNNLELVYKFNITGEKWGCLNCNLIKGIQFPSIKGVGYYPESYMWFTLAKKYKSICYNEIIRIYHTDGTSITNAYKKKSFTKFLKGAPVSYDYSLWHINNNQQWMVRYNFKEYIKTIVNIIRNGSALQHSPAYMLKNVKGIMSKMGFVLLYLPAQMYFHLIDKKNQ
jgi:glycosyltransferase involved in cell wall biosynthesis